MVAAAILLLEPQTKSPARSEGMPSARFGSDSGAAPSAIRTLPVHGRAALKEQVRRGRLGLGEAFIDLETQAEGVPSSEASEARIEYRTLLDAARWRAQRGQQDLPAAVVGALRERRLDLYRRVARTMSEALRSGGGDCTARTRLIVSLLYDLGSGSRAGARVFENHLAPVFERRRSEHRFGMVANCTGPGVQIGALALLDASFPTSPDRCQDDHALLGAPLRDDDPPPTWSGSLPELERHCPLALWPWREPGDAVLLGHPGTVGMRQDDAVTHVVTPTRAQLLSYSAGLACHKRWLSSSEFVVLPPPARLAHVAKAIGYQREAALALAAGGELAAVRMVEADEAGNLAVAGHLLRTTDFSRVELEFDFWALVYLGQRAHEIMFAMAERDTDWFASNLLGVLVVEPRTRHRALRLLLARPLPQQFEIAERVDWDEPQLRDRLTATRDGRHAERLRRTIRATRNRWSDCELVTLERLAREETASNNLHESYGPALVAALAESPILHLDRHGCDGSDFAAKLDHWAGGQNEDIQRWLKRNAPSADANAR